MNHLSQASLFDKGQTIQTVPPRIRLSEHTALSIYIYTDEDEVLTQEIIHDVKRVAQSGWYDNPWKEALIKDAIMNFVDDLWITNNIFRLIKNDQQPS